MKHLCINMKKNFQKKEN